MRSRYEVENNSYAKGMVLTLANDLIGEGPRLQLSTGNEEANDFIEREFGGWMQATVMADKLRTLHMSRVTDGEGYGMQFTNPRLPTPVQLDLRLLEGDQVATPDMLHWIENQIDGIVFDEWGNPAEYHVLKYHPGDYRVASWDYEKIPADQMVHWYRTDRPEQARGIPDIMAALPLFAQLRRYTLAVIAAAETAADFAAVVQSTAPADSESDEYAPFETIELERRMATFLPAGYNLGQIKSEQPTTTYEMFKRQILSEIARCLQLPYAVAAGDSSDHNYASGRLDWQTYHRQVRIERSRMTTRVLDRLLIAWLDEAILIPGYLPEGLPPINRWQHNWMWDMFEHVDPVKEAQAAQLRVASGFTARQIECARFGYDFRDVDRLRAADKMPGATAQQPATEEPKEEPANAA